MAPRLITDREELWAGPINHHGLIGSFFVKLYETQPTLRKTNAGWALFQVLGGRIIVGGASARETVGVTAPTVTRQPAPPRRYPICPRPRTCPHPGCSTTAFDCGGANACHIGLRGCSCWLYCSRSCSSPTWPDADPGECQKIKSREAPARTRRTAHMLRGTPSARCSPLVVELRREP
jgi:hypothetical protein